MKKLDILIAEDEPSAALDLKSTLIQKGHNVIKIVNSGNEVLNLAYQMQPDIVVIEINMKGNITGLQAAEELMNKKIPVLFVTSRRNVFDIEKVKRETLETDFILAEDIIPSTRIVNN